MTSKGPNAKNPEGRAIGPNLGPCWAKMGPSWRQVGPMLEPPGASWGGLGCLLGGLGVVLGCSWGGWRGRNRRKKTAISDIAGLGKVLGRFWVPLEATLGASWMVLGASWMVLDPLGAGLGAFWVVLGWSWDDWKGRNGEKKTAISDTAGLGKVLGRFWGPLEATLGASWMVLGAFRMVLDPLGAVLGAFWVVLGWSWDGLGAIGRGETERKKQLYLI